MNLLKLNQGKREIKAGVGRGELRDRYEVFIEQLAPQAVVLPERLLTRDKVVIVQKGQAKALLKEKLITLLPGKIAHIEEGDWFSLRNTGTGDLVYACVVSPAGLFDYYHELSETSPDDQQLLLDLSKKYEIEFKTEMDAQLNVSHTREKRLRTPVKRRNKIKTDAPTPEISSDAAPAQTKKTEGSNRLRKGNKRPEKHKAALKEKPRFTEHHRVHNRGRSQKNKGSSRVRSKEVYMDGKWVTVDTAGPVVALGARRRPQAKHAPRKSKTTPE